MNAIMYNTLRKFELCNPKAYEQLEDQIDIGDFETLFKLVDGSRIIFDEIHEVCLYLKPRDTDSPFLTEIEWKNELSRKIRKKIIINGISQRELADVIGVSPTTIGGYVKGTRCPDAYTLKLLARAFDCPVSALNDFDYLL